MKEEGIKGNRWNLAVLGETPCLLKYYHIGDAYAGTLLLPETMIESGIRDSADSINGYRVAGNFANSVYEEKARLIEENHLTIWRDHDHMHAHCPDSIFTGVIKYLGWEEYYRPEMAGGLGLIYPFEIPQTTVGALGEFLKSKLCLNGLRFLGQKDDRITRVAIAGHLYPNCFFKDGIDEAGYYRDYSMQIMELMEKENGIEAIIPGEVVEWTVLAYIRDAVAQGKVRACMNIGHFNMEELGMRYAKDWLEELTDGQIAVHYIPTGDGYCYL